MTNTDENVNYTAQQISENIEAGVEEAPQVNVEADYEKSKEFATSDDAPANTGGISMATATSSSAGVEFPETTGEGERS